MFSIVHTPVETSGYKLNLLVHLLHIAGTEVPSNRVLGKKVATDDFRDT